MSPENSTDSAYALIPIVSFKILMFSNIPFTFITIFIIAFYFNKLRTSLGSRNIQDISPESRKDRRIRILVLKFIILILLIELSTNVCGGFGGLVYGFIPRYEQRSITPTNSCQVNRDVDFQMELFPISWFAFLPDLLDISIIQLLLPTVSLLLNVLRRAYLDYPYRTIIKRWMCIILIRGCILFLLLSYFQTVYIGISILPIIFIVDFSFYIKHSRECHSLLRSRMEVARVLSSRREYRDKSRVLYQYRVTSAYTTLTFFILTLKYCLYGLKNSIHGLTRMLCLVNLITFGFFPVIVFSSNALNALNALSLYLFIAFHFLDLLYQILISFAYFLVLFAIGIRFYKQQNKFKYINTSIRPLLNGYHRTVD